MKVRLTTESPPASELELNEMQQAMGNAAPSDYIAFLAARNGCRVATNVSRIDEGNESGVNAFLQVGQSSRKRLRWVTASHRTPGRSPMLRAQLRLSSRRGLREWSVVFGTTSLSKKPH